jgi:hypothetical protein
MIKPIARFLVRRAPGYSRRIAGFIIRALSAGDAASTAGRAAPKWWEKKIAKFTSDLATRPDNVDHLEVLQLLAQNEVLPEKALSQYLTRTFTDRRLSLFEKTIANEDVGSHQLVRALHQIRLSHYQGSNEWTAQQILEIYRGAPRESAMTTPLFNLFIEQVVRDGDASLLLDILHSTEDYSTIPRQHAMGICRLLIKRGKKEEAHDFLASYLLLLDSYDKLFFLDLGRQVLGENFEYWGLNNWRAVLDEIKRSRPSLDDNEREIFVNYVVEPLRRLSIPTEQDFIDIRLSGDSQTQLLSYISGKLTSDEPLSLVRVGDGESYALEIPDECPVSTEEAREDNLAREYHWWGGPIDSVNREDIQSRVRSALSSADILGVPSPYRVLRDASGTKKRFGSRRNHRGLIVALNAIGSQISINEKVVTEERCHQVLFDSAILKSLCDQAKRVIFVGCWSADQIDFGTSTSVEHIMISPHSKVRSVSTSGEPPIHEIYPQLIARIQERAAAGTLVLVSAGIIGKAFCDAGRKAGAVALDIGSTSDYLVGYQTRAIADAVV